MKRKELFRAAIIVLFGTLIVMSKALADDKIDIKDIFEQKYNAWKVWAKAHSYLSTFTGDKTYCEIVKLGIPALPYIIDKIERNPEDFHLGVAVSRITRKRFEKSEWPTGKLGDSITVSKMYVSWYHSGRKQTPQQFNKLYSDWQSLKKQGKTKEAGEKYQRIKDLGIDALPSIMQRIERGDKDLIPVVSYLTDDNVKSNTKPADCLNWWNNNKNKWLLPPVESSSP